MKECTRGSLVQSGALYMREVMLLLCRKITFIAFWLVCIRRSALTEHTICLFVSDAEKNTRRLNMSDFKILRPERSKAYHLSWASLGQAMVRGSSSDLWIKDAFDVFLQIDSLFGRNYTSVTTPFTMYGKFDGVSNVLFHDKTIKLRNVPYIKNTDRMNNPYNVILDNIEICNSSSKLTPLLIVYICALALQKLFF